MRSFGLGLMVFGAVAALIAFFVPTTLLAPGAEHAVFNLQRGQLQLLLFQGAIGAIVSGAILYGCGAISEALGTQYELLVGYLKANGFVIRRTDGE